MKSEKAVMLLSPFTHSDKNIATGNVAFKNGFAIATDGRVLIRQEIEDKDSESGDLERFPFGRAMVMTDEVKPGEWHRISKECLARLTDEFKKKLVKERQECRVRFRDRYKEMTCPHCNGTVYLDEERDRLVTEDERDYDTIRTCDVDFPVSVQLEETKLVNFGYIYLILGQYPDMEIALDMRLKTVICLRNGRGDARGLLMPLRACGDHVGCEMEKLDLEKVTE